MSKVPDVALSWSFSRAGDKELSLIEIHHVQSTDHLRNSYNRIYINQPIRHSESFYRWIISLLDLKPGQNYIDIACGQGRLVEIACEKTRRSFGTDLSISGLQASQLRTMSFFVANGESIPLPENTIDRLTNIGSLEHYTQPQVGIEEISRVLRSDGIACILVPNTFGLLSTILYAWHNGKIADDGQPIQRYNTYYGWKEMLENGGLKIVEVRKYEMEWPSNWRDVWKLIFRPKNVVHLLLSFFVPLNLANSLVFLCVKKRKF